MARKNIPDSIKKSFKSTKNVAKKVTTNSVDDASKIISSQAKKGMQEITENASKAVPSQARNTVRSEVDNIPKPINVSDTVTEATKNVPKNAHLSQEELLDLALKEEGNMRTMPSITPLNETGQKTFLPHNNDRFINDNGLGMPTVSPVMEAQLRNADMPFDGRQQYQPKAMNQNIAKAQADNRVKTNKMVSTDAPQPNNLLPSVFTGDTKPQKGLVQQIDDLLHSRPGKIAAGVGVSAFLVSNMNRSKGQMSNAQLYGQQAPYQ